MKRKEIRAAHSGAQRPSQKFTIVVVGRARMAQTVLIQPAIGYGVIERQPGVVDGPGSPRRRRLRELTSAITTRKSQSRAARAGGPAIERFDPKLVTLPWRLLV